MLSIQNLNVLMKGTQDQVLDQVSFQINKGQILGLVGESGCGKSITALSIMGLLPENQFVIHRGQILFYDKNLLSCSMSEYQTIRGRKISMIFQEPMSSLNPLLKIGIQVSEMFTTHLGMSWTDAKKEAIRCLDMVAIPNAKDTYNSYPHHLSGGLRQRVMIAIALSLKPDFLIADEPTTALDVTIQAQIMNLLLTLQSEIGMGILLITHDLGLVAEMCDHVLVMYAGSIIESSGVADLFSSPSHPYTQGLIKATPRMGINQKLEGIKGHVPSLQEWPAGCRFHPRCQEIQPICKRSVPELLKLGHQPLHQVACWARHHS